MPRVDRCLKGVCSRLLPTNIESIGWCLHVLISWCSSERISVSFRLVPVNIVTYWCL
jgi:hypothetical protein